MRSTDRLFLDHKEGSNLILRDRISDSIYSIPENIVMPAIRRFSYFQNLDIAKESDVCIKVVRPEVETLIRSLYNSSDSSRIIFKLKAEWAEMITRGSSRLCMMWRIDWAAVGTTLICVRNDEPTFLVIKGKYFKGLSGPTHEKLLCLWFNSSAFILSYLGRR